MDEGFGGLAEVERRPTEVEGRERIGRPTLVVELDKANVPLEFFLANGVLEVSGVIDDDVGRDDDAAEAADRREDLLVDAIVPADVGMVREETDLLERLVGLV